MAKDSKKRISPEQFESQFAVNRDDLTVHELKTAQWFRDNEQVLRQNFDPDKQQTSLEGRLNQLRHTCRDLLYSVHQNNDDQQDQLNNFNEQLDSLCGAQNSRLKGQLCQFVVMNTLGSPETINHKEKDELVTKLSNIMINNEAQQVDAFTVGMLQCGLNGLFEQSEAISEFCVGQVKLSISEEIEQFCQEYQINTQAITFEQLKGTGWYKEFGNKFREGFNQRPVNSNNNEDFKSFEKQIVEDINWLRSEFIKVLFLVDKLMDESSPREGGLLIEKAVENFVYNRDRVFVASYFKRDDLGNPAWGPDDRESFQQLLVANTLGNSSPQAQSLFSKIKTLRQKWENDSDDQKALNIVSIEKCNDKEMTKYQCSNPSVEKEFQAINLELSSDEMFVSQLPAQVEWLREQMKGLSLFSSSIGDIVRKVRDSSRITETGRNTVFQCYKRLYKNQNAISETLSKHPRYQRESIMYPLPDLDPQEQAELTALYLEAEQALYDIYRVAERYKLDKQVKADDWEKLDSWIKHYVDQTKLINAFPLPGANIILQNPSSYRPEFIAQAITQAAQKDDLSTVDTLLQDTKVVRQLMLQPSQLDQVKKELANSFQTQQVEDLLKKVFEVVTKDQSIPAEAISWFIQQCYDNDDNEVISWKIQQDVHNDDQSIIDTLLQNTKVVRQLMLQPSQLDQVKQQLSKSSKTQQVGGLLKKVFEVVKKDQSIPAEAISWFIQQNVDNDDQSIIDTLLQDTKVVRQLMLQSSQLDQVKQQLSKSNKTQQVGDLLNKVFEVVKEDQSIPAEAISWFVQQDIDQVKQQTRLVSKWRSQNPFYPQKILKAHRASAILKQDTTLRILQQSPRELLNIVKSTYATSAQADAVVCLIKTLPQLESKNQALNILDELFASGVFKQTTPHVHAIKHDPDKISEVIEALQELVKDNPEHEAHQYLKQLLQPGFFKKVDQPMAYSSEFVKTLYNAKAPDHAQKVVKAISLADPNGQRYQSTLSQLTKRHDVIDKTYYDLPDNLKEKWAKRLTPRQRLHSLFEYVKQGNDVPVIAYGSVIDECQKHQDFSLEDVRYDLKVINQVSDKNKRDQLLDTYYDKSQGLIQQNLGLLCHYFPKDYYLNKDTKNDVDSQNNGSQWESSVKLRQAYNQLASNSINSIFKGLFDYAHYEGGLPEGYEVIISNYIRDYVGSEPQLNQVINDIKAIGQIEYKDCRNRLLNSYYQYAQSVVDDNLGLIYLYLPNDYTYLNTQYNNVDTAQRLHSIIRYRLRDNQLPADITSKMEAIAHQDQQAGIETVKAHIGLLYQRGFDNKIIQLKNDYLDSLSKNFVRENWEDLRPYIIGGAPKNNQIDPELVQFCQEYQINTQAMTFEQLEGTGWYEEFGNEFREGFNQRPVNSNNNEDFKSFEKQIVEDINWLREQYIKLLFMINKFGKLDDKAEVAQILSGALTNFNLYRDQFLQSYLKVSGADESWALQVFITVNVLSFDLSNTELDTNLTNIKQYVDKNYGGGSFEYYLNLTHDFFQFVNNPQIPNYKVGVGSTHNRSLNLLSQHVSDEANKLHLSALIEFCRRPTKFETLINHVAGIVHGLINKKEVKASGAWSLIVNDIMRLKAILSSLQQHPRYQSKKNDLNELVELNSSEQADLTALCLEADEKLQSIYHFIEKYSQKLTNNRQTKSSWEFFKTWITEFIPSSGFHEQFSPPSMIAIIENPGAYRPEFIAQAITQAAQKDDLSTVDTLLQDTKVVRQLMLQPSQLDQVKKALSNSNITQQVNGLLNEAISWFVQHEVNQAKQHHQSSLKNWFKNSRQLHTPKAKAILQTRTASSIGSNDPDSLIHIIKSTKNTTAQVEAIRCGMKSLTQLEPRKAYELLDVLFNRGFLKLKTPYIDAIQNDPQAISTTISGLQSFINQGHQDAHTYLKQIIEPSFLGCRSSVLPYSSKFVNTLYKSNVAEHAQQAVKAMSLTHLNGQNYQSALNRLVKKQDVLRMSYHYLSGSQKADSKVAKYYQQLAEQQKFDGLLDYITHEGQLPETSYVAVLEEYIGDNPSLNKLQSDIQQIGSVNNKHGRNALLDAYYQQASDQINANIDNLYYYFPKDYLEQGGNYEQSEATLTSAQQLRRQFEELPSADKLEGLLEYITHEDQLPETGYVAVLKEYIGDNPSLNKLQSGIQQIGSVNNKHSRDALLDAYYQQASDQINANIGNLYYYFPKDYLDQGSDYEQSEATLTSAQQLRRQFEELPSADKLEGLLEYMQTDNMGIDESYIGALNELETGNKNLVLQRLKPDDALKFADQLLSHLDKHLEAEHQSAVQLYVIQLVAERITNALQKSMSMLSNPQQAADTHSWSLDVKQRQKDIVDTLLNFLQNNVHIRQQYKENNNADPLLGFSQVANELEYIKQGYGSRELGDIAEQQPQSIEQLMDLTKLVSMTLNNSLDRQNSLPMDKKPELNKSSKQSNEASEQLEKVKSRRGNGRVLNTSGPAGEPNAQTSLHDKLQKQQQAGYELTYTEGAQALSTDSLTEILRREAGESDGGPESGPEEAPAGRPYK